jgi:hypothetical protein
MIPEHILYHDLKTAMTLFKSLKNLNPIHLQLDIICSVCCTMYIKFLYLCIWRIKLLDRVISFNVSFSQISMSESNSGVAFADQEAEILNAQLHSVEKEN